MKAISGSIFFLSGAVVVSGGVVTDRGESPGIIMLGCVVGLFGLCVWYLAIRKSDG